MEAANYMRTVKQEKEGYEREASKIPGLASKIRQLETDLGIRGGLQVSTIATFNHLAVATFNHSTFQLPNNSQITVLNFSLSNIRPSRES